MHEDLDANIVVSVGAKDVTVSASDGDAGPNYSNYFNAKITVDGKTATSKEAGNILPDQEDSGGNSGGNESGSNERTSGNGDNGVHPVNIQYPDGSISPGYSEPGGAYYDSGSATYIPPGQTYE